MPRGQRPYRPKIKGCFECSKRRIHCDRAEPECGKCLSKGLTCSGLGVRYRFNNGLAARGHWRGKDYQEPQEETTPRYPVLQFRHCVGGTAPFLPVEDDSGDAHPDVAHGPSDAPADVDGLSSEAQPLLVKEAQSQEGQLSFLTGYFPISRLLPSTNISPRASSLLQHFSEHIAGEMVAIDGLHNGWRHLVLPVAHTDTLVLTAVLAAASFHVRAKRRAAVDQDPESSRLYYQAIRQLQQRQNLAFCDDSAKLSVLLTLLILLVAVMVTGSDDFPVVFGLLERALDAMGGEESLGAGELSSFILRQIHKLRVYAAPLLSEHTGIAILSSQAQIAQGFECVRFCLKQQPKYSRSVSAIENLIQQSREIYLQQAARSSHPYPSVLQQRHIAESITRIQMFKETLETFPHGEPGAQVLIWATFMAASDCILPEHQAFFTQVLRQYHERSGFLNLHRGLEHLQSIWKQRGCSGDSWISLLPRANVFVM